jgi:hypothetical protein
MTRFLLLSDSCRFVDVGRSLWREDESVVYNCCWPSPEQSLSGPSLVGLVTIFYCLRLETSLSVASYDSQGYGGGIPPRLHCRESTTVSELYYNRQSVGQFVLVSSTHLELTTRFLLLSHNCGFIDCWAPSLTRVWVCLLLCTMYTIFAFYMLSCIILHQPSLP